MANLDLQFAKRRKVIERVFSFWIVLELSGLKVEQLRYKIKKRTSAILLMVSIALFFSKIPKNVKTSFLSSTCSDLSNTSPPFEIFKRTGVDTT